MTTAHDSARPELTARLNGLDHLRALAITLVFLFHYGRLFPHPEWVETISKYGWTGVDLFFVLSGYLIASQLFSSIESQGSFSWSEFFTKRFFRIIPAYLVMVALYFLFPVLREREGLAPLWKYLSFTQNFGLDLHVHGTFSHAWSLCIEEQFYFFLPLTLLLLLRKRWLRKGYLILIGLWIAGFVLRWYSWAVLVEPLTGTDTFGLSWYKYIYYPTYCRLDGLIAGVSIAAAFQFAPRFKMMVQKRRNILLVLGIVLSIGAYFLCLDEISFRASVFGFPLVALGYACIVAAAISPSCFLYKVRSRATTFIAALSYGIYLTHKIIIHSIQNLLLPIAEPDGMIVFLCCILASVIGAWVLQLLVEQPMLQLRNLIVKRRKIHQKDIIMEAE